ncbi:MAG: PrsW family intramembrane metalloprotease [Solobacterium sp.]|nr:PrsW family intramembrane metalloprotease [Solobacterium sp.]
MLINIIVFLLSIIPSALIILWLMRRKENDLYKASCKDALHKGLFCVFPILGVSAIFAITLSLTRTFIYKDMPVLLYQALYKFIVLAFAEELVKYILFKKVLKRRNYTCSWADITAFMVIIGTAFGLIEDIPYAIGASPMVMIVRGITMGHVGYGFLMGYYYGKKLYTGNRKYGIMAFMIPFLLHGLYDFSLSEELLAANDNFAFLAVNLAFLEIIFLILMIHFFRKEKKKPKHFDEVIPPEITVKELV